MNILLAEDDLDSRISISEFLQDLGHQVTECIDGEQALHCFRNDTFELVLTDIKMPKLTGIKLIHHLNEYRQQRDFEIIVFTGHGDMETAIESLRAGALDYLLKPISIEQLADITERLVAAKAVKRIDLDVTDRTNERLENAPKGSLLNLHKWFNDGYHQIGVFSGHMQALYEKAMKLHFEKDMPILIQGETGTGKEIIARLIHYGPDPDQFSNLGEFVDINCAALSPTLFESELFGYEAGAYTGANTKGSRGKLDLATGGTLFLDEIGELSAELQAKLLRVIQEKKYYRVGGLKKVNCQARIICATNVNLKEKVNQGMFRADLYYRLNVGNILIPPLRETKEAILPLANMFLHHFADRKKHQPKVLSPEAEDILLRYTWPGNIRELRNLLEWVVFSSDAPVLTGTHLGIHDNAVGHQLQQDNLPDATVSPKALTDLVLPDEGLDLTQFVNRIILAALGLNKGNKTQTASYLGITRRSLYCYLNKIESEK